MLTLIAANASALNTETKKLLATIAMPLAVEAVSRVTGVPQTQLSSLVSTLNQADVPPAQFVDVIRYTPLALVDQNGQPFVAYVQDQSSRGLTGDALVKAIVQQLQTKYNVRPQLSFNAEPQYVIADNYIPDTIVSQLGTTPATYDDALAVAALPLAVAAVSDIAGVPQDQLARLIATLNNANVPPAQMIELVRYVPVVLVDDPQPFVAYVQQQTAQGITGPALVPVIVQRLQPFYPSTTINVTPPRPALINPATNPVAAPAVAAAPATVRPRARIVEVDRDFVPQVVVNRVAEVRAHPHGGPPGQLKKAEGLQTGAQVVHAEQARPEKEHEHGRGNEERRIVVAQPAPAPPVVQPMVMPPQAQGHGNGRGPEGNGPPGQNKQGQEHGKGKGKD